MMTIIMAILAGFMLILMFTELFGVLFQSMKVSHQTVWEHDHLQKHGYIRRKKQLWVHVAVTGGFMVAFFALGVKCWAALQNLSGQYFITGRDKYGEALFGGGALFVLALACGFRISILRAKFKAIRQMSLHI
jgi:hypothetical protein